MSRDFPNDKGDERIEVGTWAIPASSTAIVMGARVRFDELGSDARFFSKGTNAVTANHWYMIGKRNSNDRFRIRLKLNGSTVTWEASAAQLLDTTGLWYHCIFRWASARSSWQVYVREEGAAITSDGAGAATGSITAGGTEAVWIGNQPGTSNTGMNGQLADVFVDVADWSNDKMQAWVHGAPTAALLENPAGYWPLFGTGDPEPDLSGNLRNGTLAGTGTIIAGENPGAVAAPFGRSTFFVPVAAVAGAVSIVPPAANLQLSTTAPVRLLETFRIPPAAQLQLSTAAPTISFSLSIQPPAANLALSTTAPIVAVTENVSIEVPAAQLQLSATAPTIETPIGIEVPAAQLQISTATPAILFGFTISPPAAQLALSTATPIVAAGANVSITIPAAQLEISTTAPEIETPVGITIPAAQLQLSTTAPTINQGFSIEIPAANLELSTTAPDIETPVGIEVPAANLEISTTAPSVLVFGGDVAIEIPAAQLVLSTTAPTVQAGANISIEIPAAQLEISTSVADLVLDLIRQPDAAQIQITTAAPSLIVTSNIEIEPPAAQLTLSTAAPTFDVAGPVSLEIPAAQLALSTFQPLVNVSLPSTVGKATVYCYLLLENGDLLQFEDTTQPGRLLLEDSIVSPITDSLTMNLPVDLILFDPVEVDEKPK